MRPRAGRPVLLAAVCLMGCAHSGSSIKLSEGADLARIHRIGVMPFPVPGGKGAALRKDLEDALRGLGYDVVDDAKLDRAMAGHRLDSEFGYGLEAAADVRIQTGADGVLVGRVARNWSAAFIILMETDMGDKVFSGVVRPEMKGQKAFKGPDELARTIAGIFARLGKAGF